MHREEVLRFSLMRGFWVILSALNCVEFPWVKWGYLKLNMELLNKPLVREDWARRELLLMSCKCENVLQECWKEARKIESKNLDTELKIVVLLVNELRLQQSLKVKIVTLNFYSLCIKKVCTYRYFYKSFGTFSGVATENLFFFNSKEAATLLCQHSKH